MASSLFVGVIASGRSTGVDAAVSNLGRTAIFASVRAGEGRGVADRESVESVNALPTVEGLPMSDALVALCFVMIVLGPCVVASLVDLNRSVPD